MLLIPKEGEPFAPEIMQRMAGKPSICLKCYEIMVFEDDEGHLRRATDEELASFRANAPLWAGMQKAIEALKWANFKDEDPS